MCLVNFRISSSLSLPPGDFIYVLEFLTIKSEKTECIHIDRSFLGRLRAWRLPLNFEPGHVSWQEKDDILEESPASSVVVAGHLQRTKDVVQERLVVMARHQPQKVSVQ